MYILYQNHLNQYDGMVHLLRRRQIHIIIKLLLIRSSILLSQNHHLISLFFRAGYYCITRRMQCLKFMRMCHFDLFILYVKSVQAHIIYLLIMIVCLSILATKRSHYQENRHINFDLYC
jgi:hypothetical protein